jgi:hypothetical protein
MFSQKHFSSIYIFTHFSMHYTDIPPLFPLAGWLRTNRKPGSSSSTPSPLHGYGKGHIPVGINAVVGKGENVLIEFLKAW